MAKQLFLEEAVLDDLSQEFDSLELPLSERAFKLFGWITVAIAGIVLFRILMLGWFNKDFWAERALLNSNQIITIRAERGMIFDRFGKPLLTNQPAFRVNINLGELLKDEPSKIKTVDALESVLSFPKGRINSLISNVNLEKQNSLTLSRGADIDQVLKIKNLNLAAVQIESDFKRQYQDGEIFAHVLGYTGAVDKNDLAADPDLSLNDTIGKSGIEAYYDKELRGEDGKIINYKNSKGELVGEKKLKSASPGDELYLTIDADFQTYFYSRLKRGLDVVGSEAGVGIALDPQTGEVLALVNIPSFDNNKIQVSDLLNPMKPLFNRAISGLYPPGSTIKPLVAYAALKEKVISSEKQIYSPGYLDLPNPYNPDQPSRFLDWRPQGWVDIYSAIAKSSNVYFYEVGGGFADQPGLGILKLKEYWQKLGLGKKTGIDLPAENTGFLPDPDTKEKAGRGIWRIGDTYNIAIGQGDLLTTPIQLVNHITSIANGGKIYQPFISKKINGSDGQTLKEISPRILADYSVDIEIIKKVERGMIDAVEKDYGTSRSLSDLPLSIAAKTGTAQVEANTKTDAFFVGYAPTGADLHEPKIAILVLIENAREGSLNAVPVAKDVLNWYYYNRIKSLELSSN